MADANIRKNYIYNLAYQILTLLTPFITMPYVSRILSPASIGLQSFSFSVSQTFGLFANLGIFTYGTREISYFRNDRAQVTQIFWELKELSLMTSVVCFFIYAVFVEIYVKDHRVLFWVLLPNVIGASIDCMWLFSAFEEFGKIVSRQIIFKILDIAFIFIFIKHDSDLNLYVFGSVFFSTLTTITLWFELPKYINMPDWKKLKPFRHIKVTFFLFLPTVAIQIYSILDKVMLGFISETTIESGYYELALRISKMPLMVVASLAGVIMPRIGWLFKQNDYEAVSSYIYYSFRYVWFISVPLCLGLIAASDNFIAWFLGAEYLEVAKLLKVSSFLLIIIGLANVTGSQYMIPVGRQNQFTLTVTIGAGVNFILNMFLIRMFYSYGALAASVIAEFSVLASQLYFLRKEFSIVKIFLCGTKYILAGLVMFVLCAVLNKKLPQTPLGTFTIIFSGAGVYFSVLLILRDEFFISNVRRSYEQFYSAFRNIAVTLIRNSKFGNDTQA